MSKLEDLIQKYCPNGVEKVELGKVCDILDSQRKPISKGKRISGEYPYYGANGIQDYVDGYIFDGTYLLIGEDGSVINSDNTPVLNWAQGKIWVNNHAHILAEQSGSAKLRYLYFILQCTDVSELVHGVPPKLNQASLRSISVPLPPLPVQEEIVRILDAMTDLQENLEKELEERRKQYAFYRDKLLSFNELTTPPRWRVEWKQLGELFELRNGYTPSKNNNDFWENGTIPWFRMEDIRTNGRILNDSMQHVTESAIKNCLFPANSIIVATSATIGEHALITVPSLSNQRFTYLVPKKEYGDKIIMKYMFYYMFLVDEWCKTHTLQGNFAGVDMSAFRELPIPLPSLSIQQEIVEKLDTMEELVSNIENELTERKKQYEYYREKLLLFAK